MGTNCRQAERPLLPSSSPSAVATLLPPLPSSCFNVVLMLYWCWQSSRLLCEIIYSWAEQKLVANTGCLRLPLSFLAKRRRVINSSDSQQISATSVPHTHTHTQILFTCVSVCVLQKSFIFDLDAYLNVGKFRECCDLFSLRNGNGNGKAIGLWMPKSYISSYISLYT